MSKTMKEMSEIKLEATKYLISTFKDLMDLEELKKWVDEEWKDHFDLVKYIEKMRLLSLEYGKPELFEKWKEDNQGEFLGFKTLNKLRDDLKVKFCLACGEPMRFKRTTRKYCKHSCLIAAYRKRRRLRENMVRA